MSTGRDMTLGDAQESPASSAIAQSLAALERWFAGWRAEDGGYRGLIATFWDGSDTWIASHVMNSYPVILGYRDLYSRFGDPRFLDRAREDAEYLLAHQMPSGLFTHAFGDVPGKGTGPVVQACPGLSLARLASTLRDAGEPWETYAVAAQRCAEGILSTWFDGRVLTNRVANQELKTAELLLALADLGVNRDRYLQIATLLGDWSRQQQVREPGPAYGGIYQADHDDRIFSVYVAKCIPPLVELSRLPGGRRFMDAAVAAGTFLQTRRDGQTGLFESHMMPAGTSSFRYRLAASVRGRLSHRVAGHRLEGLVRLRRRLGGGWTSVREPVWIARAASIVTALLRLSEKGALEYNPWADVRVLLSHQHPDGGFANAVGLGPGWRDRGPCPRWNAYVFQLLCHLTPAPPEPLQSTAPEPTFTIEEPGVDGTPRRVTFDRRHDLCVAHYAWEGGRE